MSATKRTVRSTKSHQGCRRCKVKKIKCDETKPACLACQRAGDECPGFAPQFKWSRKHEKFDRTVQHTRAASEPHAQPQPNGASEQKPLPPISEATDHGAADLSMPMEFDNNTFAASAPEAMAVWYSQYNSYNQTIAEPDMSDWFSFENMRMLDPGLSMDPSMNPTNINVFGQDLMFPDFGPTATARLLDNTQGHSTPEREERSRSTQSTSSPSNRQFNQPVLQPIQQQQQLWSNSDSFLETFYRLSTPTPIAQFSAEHLIKHYFGSVSPLYSSFDSHLNPFRTLVGELWSNSNTIYFAIQAMAIAHLANHYLYMAPLGLAKRSQAWKSLQLDLQAHRKGKISLETILMSLLLLGLSSTWHNPNNLGLQYLFVARTLMQTHLRNRSKSQAPLSHEKFFRDALLHWEMLASFVEPVPMMPFPGFGTPIPHLPAEQGPKAPHSWTGVGTEIHFALAEIGRILRRKYRRPGATGATAERVRKLSNAQFDIDRQWSGSLEKFLLSIRIPDEEDIEDYGDEDTPKLDLIRAAHAQRYVGLLEIYAAFPVILEDRLASDEKLPALHDRELEPPTDNTSYTETTHSHLCALAIQILDLIKDTAINSGASRLQPLVLVSCAAQLRVPPMDDGSDRQTEVVDTRAVIEARMLALSRRFPQRHQLQMLDIVKEVWQRLDEEEGESAGAHWLDVAFEKGWVTLIG